MKFSRILLASGLVLMVTSAFADEKQKLCSEFTDLMIKKTEEELRAKGKKDKEIAGAVGLLKAMRPAVIDGCKKDSLEKIKGELEKIKKS